MYVDPPLAPQQARPKRRWLRVASAFAAVVIAAVGAIAYGHFRVNRTAGANPTPSAQVRQFPDLIALCYPDGNGVTIADGGRTLVIDGVGRFESSGFTDKAIRCGLDRLGMPVAVQEHVFATRALDGRQEDSWAGFRVSWSYHPDDGLDMVVQMV